MKHPILDMLTYCRPAGSVTEREFCERFIAPMFGAYQDNNGNWIIITDDTAPILFSAHTDTVHHKPGRQTIRVTDGMARLSKRARRDGRNCLGADDTAGCWLLLELIAHGVPGTYVFHYGEERGGIGSSAMARQYSDWLKRFTHAIAFDRRGTADVITHQSGMRSASDVFAWSLATALEKAGLPNYAPEHGIYTDTAEYTDLIGECTNLSVGYRWEHSTSECLDLAHLARLRDALVKLDWSSLQAERTPGELDPEDRWSFSWRRWRDDEPRDAKTDDDGTPIVLCLACGESFAHDEDICPHCGEDEDFDVIETRDVANDTPYLDPVYEEVQRELAATMIKWRQTRGDK